LGRVGLTTEEVVDLIAPAAVASAPIAVKAETIARFG
jgi:hypothetical protein